MTARGPGEPRERPAEDRHPVGPADRERMRMLLERERERLVRRIARDEADRKAFLDRVGERDPCAFLSPAAAAEDAEQAARARTAGEATEQLAAVEHALRRLAEDPERFGVCARCQASIPVDRLEVLPHSPVCHRCTGEGREG
jgi:RNA polymerase-binding transcription factor DksA